MNRISTSVNQTGNYSTSRPPQEYKFDNSNERVKKYLDINSTNRNRNTNPLQSDFVIPFSSGGQKGNVFDSMDPVVLGVPYETGTIITGTTGGVVLAIPPASTLTNFYVNNVIEVTFGNAPQFRKIIAYSGAGLAITGAATVDPAFTSTPTVGAAYNIRKAFPIATGAFQAGSTTISAILSSTSASSTNDEYKGKFLRIRNSVYSNLFGQIKLIAKPTYTGPGFNPQFAYNGSTKVAFLNSSLPTGPASGDTYEILEYSYDNLVPLIYSGSSIFGQAICYRIRLLNIVLPNQTLNVGYGGTIDRYPYLYVRLYSDSMKNSEQALYSNNPYSKSALFKVMIRPTDYSGATQFVAFEGPGETQTIKFKPNDSLHFTVTLPNGELINYVTPDNSSPLFPNPLLQISTLFEIERLD